MASHTTKSTAKLPANGHGLGNSANRIPYRGLPCGRIDVEGLARERYHLWAEAKGKFDEGCVRSLDSAGSRAGRGLGFLCGVLDGWCLDIQASGLEPDGQ